MFESKLDLRTGSGITREFFRQIEPYDSANQEIESQAFSSLANLAHLDVTGNRMTKLEDIMMRYPSNLKALYLDHNR